MASGVLHRLAQHMPPRIIDRYRSLVKRFPSRWRTLNLFFGALTCAILGTWGLYVSEPASHSETPSPHLQQAADAWASQQVLRDLGTSAAAHGAAYEKYRKQAMQALGISPVVVPGPPNSWSEYLVSDDTVLRGTLQTFGTRAATVLLVVALLLILAIPLIPYIERLVGIGEDRVKDATAATSEKQHKIQPMPQTMLGLTSPPAGIGASNTTSAAAPVTLSPLSRGLIPALAVAGAAITVGLITLVIPARTVRVDVNDPRARGTMSVDDLRLQVTPGPVTITPAMINQPHGDYEIPKLSFTFPAIPIEDQSLHGLVEALVAYRQTIATAQEQQQRLLAMHQTVLALAADNAALRQQARDAAQQEMTRSVLRELSWHREDTHAIREALDRLTQPDILPAYVKNQQSAETATGLNFTWTLNQENQRWTNQVFHPGLVQHNFATCLELAKIIPSHEPCQLRTRREALLQLVPDPLQRGAARAWQFLHRSAVITDLPTTTDSTSSPSKPQAQ